MSIRLPTVVHEIDSWISSIDGSIRLTADAHGFSYNVPVAAYDMTDRIPGDVYTLVDHYTKRGFVCTYDGIAGLLNIAWDHPNMSYQDVTYTTRANSDLILTLGDGFPASKLYLCMTHGQDLRNISDISLTRDIQQKINRAAASGLKYTTVRFEGVPHFVIEALYASTFADLRASGFGVSYDSVQDLWFIRWDDGNFFPGFDGGLSVVDLTTRNAIEFTAQALTGENGTVTSINAVADFSISNFTGQNFSLSAIDAVADFNLDAFCGATHFVDEITNASTEFDPATLFTGSDTGWVADATGATNLYQGTTTATTPVTNPGETIGYMADISPSGHHFTQATAANRMIWRGQPHTLGGELLSNGRFTSTDVWTAGTGYVITPPAAVKTAGVASSLSQPVALTAGTMYMIFYTVTRTAGIVTPTISGGTAITLTARSASGSYSDVFIANAGNTTLEFLADAAFAGSIKSVTLKPVTHQVCMGAWMFASSRKIVSPVFNWNSDKATIGFSTTYDKAIASTNFLSFGNWGASQNGSIWTGYSTAPVGRHRGDTASGSITLAAIDSLTGAGGAFYVDIHEFDLAQTALTDEITVTTAGVVRTGTSSGSAGGGGNYGNYAVDIGMGNYRGAHCRSFGINRKLTAPEKAQVQTWLKGRTHFFACTLGDSTMSALSGVNAISSRVSSFIPGAVCGRNELAEAGRRISDMLTSWNAVANKTVLDVVFIQIGANDIKGRIGENTATSSTVIGDLQNLVNTVRAGVSATCKIVVIQVPPCRAWLEASTNPSAAYAGWLAFNEAIAGLGSSPITGVDGRVTQHVALLGDVNNYLLDIYNYNLDNVHESDEGRFIIGIKTFDVVAPLLNLIT